MINQGDQPSHGWLGLVCVPLVHTEAFQERSLNYGEQEGNGPRITGTLMGEWKMLVFFFL